MDAKKFIKALKELEGDKNIPSEIVLDSLKQALVLAYQQKIENAKDSMARVEIDPKKGNIRMFAQKTIVEEVEDDYLEISLEDAQVYNPDYKVGDIFETEVNVDDYNRMAALYVKQILRQKLREAEKQIIFDEYIENKIRNGRILENRYKDDKIIFINKNKEVLAIYEVYEQDKTKVKPFKVFNIKKSEQ